MLRYRESKSHGLQISETHHTEGLIFQRKPASSLTLSALYSSLERNNFTLNHFGSVSNMALGDLSFHFEYLILKSR